MIDHLGDVRRLLLVCKSVRPLGDHNGSAERAVGVERRLGGGAKSGVFVRRDEHAVVCGVAAPVSGPVLSRELELAGVEEKWLRLVLALRASGACSVVWALVLLRVSLRVHCLREVVLQFLRRDAGGEQQLGVFVAVELAHGHVQILHHAASGRVWRGLYDANRSIRGLACFAGRRHEERELHRAAGLHGETSVHRRRIIDARRNKEAAFLRGSGAEPERYAGRAMADAVGAVD